ncbi:MAG: ROK family protein [Rhodospirillaceae bacterium]
MKHQTVRCGIDLGGTKIELIALGADGQELIRFRQASPQGSYTATLDCLVAMVTHTERQLACTLQVGIGIPGSLSLETNLVKNANSTWLIGHPLADDLSARLERPVKLANDANCFVLSEAVDGAASGFGMVYGVILGTGVGGGIAIDRRVRPGANAIAGEWGHNPLPWPTDDERPGNRCYCGQHGCIETFLSGPAFARQFYDQTHRQLSPSEIAAAADHDHEARAAIATYADRLARSLAQVINILDPDAIVLGGGMSNVSELYDAVPALWSKYVFSDSVRTKLLAPRHGDASGVRGAAWL